MKKNLNFVLLRTLCTLIVGGLMIAFSSEISSWLVLGIGSLVVISGVAALVAHFLRPKGEPTNYAMLLVATVGIIGGASFLLNSEANASYLFYFLGALPILGAIVQYALLIRLHRKGFALPSIAYAIPTAVILLCTAVLVWTDFFAQLPILLFGVAWVVYSFFELILLFRFSQLRSKLAAEEQAQVESPIEALPAAEAIETETDGTTTE